jgi:hypothetical protein
VTDKPKKKQKKNGAAHPKARKSVAAPRKSTKAAANQIVVTLSMPKGEVVKVEKFPKSGQSREVTEEEFAALAGADEFEDLSEVLEETYAAGVTDAIDDELADDDFDDDGEVDRFILREAAGLILRRVLRRELVKKRAHAAHKATPDASGQHSPA